MRRTVPLAVTAVLVLGALAGCSATASSAGGSSVDFQSGSGRMPAAAPAGSASGTTGQAASAAKTDRSVVTTGSLDLVADHPIAVADRITALVEAAAGRVATSKEDPDGRASASLVLRIPADAFPRVLADIEHQGDVRNVSVGATDVTATVTDYTVRIANLRASIARLQQLLAKADSSSALVTIEGALTDRQTSLEQLLAQQRALTDEVSYATLSVSVVTPAAAPAKGPGDFLGGQAAAAFAIGLGVALPWLVVLGALAAIAAGVLRVVRRRARPTSA